jgi:single-strand DNA-binding protein
MATSKKTQAPSQETTPTEDTFRSYNRVALAGRLAAEPELKHTNNGKAVCRLRVATNSTKIAEFHDVVTWEDLAETAAKTLSKGSKVVLEGRLQTRSWEAKDGSKRWATEIVASVVTAA